MAQTETLPNQTAPEQGTEVRNVEYEAVSPTAPTGQENLDLLLEISLPITVIIGKAKIPLKKLLQLGPGAVLSLDKSIGQPVELYVQDIPFATADVVVVNDSFAVRIRELLGTEEQKPAAAGK